MKTISDFSPMTPKGRSIRTLRRMRNADLKPRYRAFLSFFVSTIHNPQSAIKRGFTLLEVLVSLAIVGLTLTVLIHSQILSVRQVTKAKHHTIALFLANQILSDTFIQDEPLMRIEENKFEDYPGFSWQREVEDSDIEDLKAIKITISGPENTQIVLNTYRLQQNVIQTRR